MSRYRTAYPPEFRRQTVDLVRSGRTARTSFLTQTVCFKSSDGGQRRDLVGVYEGEI